MWGYFGQAYFGGAAFQGSAPGPSGTAKLGTDAASTTDWDVATSGLGSDETASATDSAVATGLGTATGPVTASDSASAGESAVTVGLTQPTPTPGRTIVRFVDAVGTGAALRLDVSVGYWDVLFDGTTTPPPPMVDQRATSMLLDGDLVTASVYRNREVTVALLLDAPTAQAAAVEMQKLQRELDRPTNVIWYQPDTNLPPVFFRTYRGPDVTSDLDYGLVLHKFKVTLEAEPFALGDPVNLGQVTVNHDPSAGSNPCHFDLSGITGDVDTPLYLTTTDVDLSQRKTAFATRRRGTPSNVPWYRQAEDTGLTLGSGVARASGDATASAGGYVRVTFAAGEGNLLRLSGVFPGTGAGSVDWRGTYRVVARMRPSASGGAITAQLATSTAAASRGLAVPIDVSQFAGGTWGLYDLGLVRLPVGNTGQRAGYGAEHPAAGSALYLYAERTAGSASLDVDYLHLVPADEDYALVQFPSISGTTGAVVDGPNGEVYFRNAVGELATSPAVLPYVDCGRLPTVSPLAATNRVFVLNGVVAGSGTALSTTLGNAVTFNVTYWPRYRVVRPVGT